ncbi:MAG: TIM barrel protein [Planctomycetota bacterium]
MRKKHQDSSMGRRQFNSLLSATAMLGTMPVSFGLPLANENKSPFKLKFAPHPGMFKSTAGKDVIDQIKFAHDQGFTAWEMNGLPKETPEMQEKIGQTLADLNMTMGVFVAYAKFDKPTFAVKNKEDQDEILAAIKQAVEIGKRVNARWCTVVPGSIDQQHSGQEQWKKYGGSRLADGYQTANVIDMLRRCCEILEGTELTMVLEPLNWHANHGGTFLRDSDQAFMICRAVNHPACKILFDIYHQQISEGNLIPNIDRCWNEIAYFQAGDNPGRKEPGTGEINYQKVFQFIYDRAIKQNRDFIVGMEHGNSQKGKQGEQAVIDAYLEVNPS